jgi:hypothetical protein
MPRFFFDFVVNGTEAVDDTGSEFPSEFMAHDAAIRAAVAAADEHPATPCDITITVRDSAGENLAQVTLALRAKWLVR